MGFEKKGTLNERLTELLSDLQAERPNHWSRWVQIAGGAERLEASLLTQATAQGLDSNTLYLHWFNTNTERLPYVTSRDGILRGRIEEDIRDIANEHGFEVRGDALVDKYEGDPTADTQVRDDFLAWTKGLGLTALVESFLALARVKPGIEDPHDFYITSVGQEWGILTEDEVQARIDEIDRELGEPDPRVLALLRSLGDEPAADVADELSGAVYGVHNVTTALADALGLESSIVSRDLPDLSREECSFTFQTSRDGVPDAIELVVHGGVASNRYIEKVLRLSTDKGRKGSRIVALPLERTGLPEA